MMKLLIPLCLIIIVTRGEDTMEENKIPDTLPEEEQYIPELEDFAGTKNIRDVLEKMEHISSIAEKSRREGILPTEHAEELYDQMVETLDELIDLVKNPYNAYKFLNSKGVDRIVSPIIGINYEPLKKQLLILIKTLFNVAPTTTNVLIPISVVDKLLDIFENDDNLALKAHALDIMYIWLPNNPKIQARVMRLKGLEPFYHQAAKLDTSVVHTLLDLFNKIIQEHLRARDKKSQKSKDDYENMKLYEMIGLIERMSTSTVCNGLLNIFGTLLTYDYTEDDASSVSIFDLIKNIKPFCLKNFKGKPQAIKLFGELKKFITDPGKKEIFDKLGLNVTEVTDVVEEYSEKIKDNNIHDEF